MSYKLIGKRGNISFEISADDIKNYIKKHRCSGEIQLTDYLLDESGNIEGIKGSADLGHGYGFNNGWKEFSIKVGETYSFTHEYTSVDGPSGWSTGSFKVALQLVKSE